MKLGESQGAIDVKSETMPGDYASPGRALSAFRMVRNDPESVASLIIAARFWWQVEQTPEHWIWHGPMLRSGANTSPIFRISSARNVDGRSARRVAWELCNGKLPKHRRVLLCCDELRCIRPEAPHTTLNHAVDATERLALISARGDAAKQVERNIKIRSLYRSGLLTLQEIGDLYKITRERIRQIVEMGEAGMTSEESIGAPSVAS